MAGCSSRTPAQLAGAWAKVSALARTAVASAARISSSYTSLGILSWHVSLIDGHPWTRRGRPGRGPRLSTRKAPTLACCRLVVRGGGPAGRRRDHIAAWHPLRRPVGPSWVQSLADLCRRDRFDCRTGGQALQATACAIGAVRRRRRGKPCTPRYPERRRPGMRVVVAAGSHAVLRAMAPDPGRADRVRHVVAVRRDRGPGGVRAFLSAALRRAEAAGGAAVACRDGRIHRVVDRVRVAVVVH